MRPAQYPQQAQPRSSRRELGDPPPCPPEYHAKYPTNNGLARRIDLAEPPSAPPEELASPIGSGKWPPKLCDPDAAPPEEHDCLHTRVHRAENENINLRQQVDALSQTVNLYADKHDELDSHINSRNGNGVGNVGTREQLRALAKQGAASDPKRHRKNEGVPGHKGFQEPPPHAAMNGSKVRMVIVALDYSASQVPLTSTVDGQNMEKLAAACGVQETTVLYNEQGTFQNVVKTVMDVGYSCGPDDYFIFYFAGHGTSVKDEDGDEEDGQDEAFCFLTPSGKLTPQSCMIDDIFADLILRSVPQQTRVLILTDCCHSGSIADLTKSAWDSRRAISISGCLDNEKSSDMGKGGVFTHSLLLAIDRLCQGGPQQMSVGKLFNAVLREDERTFKASQTITIHYSKGVTPHEMAWPLIPICQGGYEAPLRKASRTGALQSVHLATRDGDIPDELAQWASEMGIDLNDDYKDDELENGWKPYRTRVESIEKELDKMNLD